MNEEKWNEIKYRIKDSFGLLEEKIEDDNFSDDVGHEFKGEKETIVFENPNGRFKVERIIRPIILEKKPHYHKGMGGTARLEYVVSDSETTSTIKVFSYNKNTDDWDEVDLKGGGFSL